MSQIKMLLPLKCKEKSYFKGYIYNSEPKHTPTIIYVTEYTSSYQCCNHRIESKNIIHGYFKNNLDGKEKLLNLQSIYNHYIVLENNKNLRVAELVIDGRQISDTHTLIIILYDDRRMKNSEAFSNSSELIQKLQCIMQDEHEHLVPLACDKMYKPPLQGSYWLSSSMFIQHFLNYFYLIYWLIRTTGRDKKIHIKAGNLILAIGVDIFLGYVALNLLSHEAKDLSAMLMGVLEKLVSFLYSLLKWLMGAPAGLKLNNAFNKMLGKYFSYHIQLWWLFLDVTGGKLDTILHLYHYLGYLGFTFQAAIISDMICVATFHSYCIYVYAARLFNIQISGLVALLRLFVGRKYNPLRGGIDSCEYTNQELFVGTVAFTILLLLLPTTTMYYIVFTLFRLLSLVVQNVLAKIIYLVQTLPLYVISLWLVDSPKVAGNILMEVVNSEEGSPLVLRVKVFKKSLHELVKQFRPPVEAPRQFEWTNVLSNIFVVYNTAMQEKHPSWQAIQREMPIYA